MKGSLQMATARAAATENSMAKDIHDLLIDAGLDQKRFSIYVCSKANRPIVITQKTSSDKLGLPFYVQKSSQCSRDQARQVGRCDMVVVDMVDQKV